MQLGVGLPASASAGYSVPPATFERYARAAEEYGFSGLWHLDHVFRPATYATSLFDPLTALSVAAGATDSIPLGASILILPLRNPVLVAKRAATLQYLSGRELTLGLGLGYAPVEYDAVGVALDERASRFREGVEVLSALFSGDPVDFDGEHHSLEGVRLEPRPTRTPRLLAGGGGFVRDGERRVPRGVRERVCDADGWIAQPRSFEALESDWAALADHVAANGRDPAEYDRVAFQYVHLVPGADTELATEKQRRVYRRLLVEDEDIAGGDAIDVDRYLTGSVEDVRADLDRYRELGFDHVILYPATTEPHELLRQLSLWERHLLR